MNETNTENLMIPLENLTQKIIFIRGQRVMIDKDLAKIYGVTTGNLNLAIKRNAHRFPVDFMFQLTKEEFNDLILQSARSSWGGSRQLPYVFTEHGVAMLSSVLNSPKAIQMNIYIIRAFIKMREMLSMDKNIELKLLKFESELNKRGEDIKGILLVLRQILNEPIKPSGSFGFKP